MAKKTPEEIFREMEEKAKAMYGAVHDPQFQTDVVENAKTLGGKAAQGAMNIGNKIGNTMEDFSVPSSAVVDPRLANIASALAGGINDAGTALKQGIYDMRTGGQPAAPYPDVGALMTGNANSINANMKPPGMMPRAGQTGVLENQIIAELQQMGLPITPETVQQYMQYKAQAQSAGQQIQQGAQKGMDWARGLLQ